jgi:hypothetical protein
MLSFKAVNRCCDSEVLEIKNYKIEHFFGGNHNYNFKCSLKESITTNQI